MSVVAEWVAHGVYDYTEATTGDGEELVADDEDLLLGQEDLSGNSEKLVREHYEYETISGY